MSKLNFKYTSDQFKLIKGTSYSAGLDIKSAENFILNPDGRYAFSTGVTLMNCPEDCYLRVAPRSGLAYKYGIDVLAGVVDADYRGEIKVILINTGNQQFHVSIGDRIAQLIPTQIASYSLESEAEVLINCRLDGKFGSTN
jgi:dUTP pyrophosphatase